MQFLTTQHDKNTSKISVYIVVLLCFCRVVVVFFPCCVVKKLYTLGMICTVFTISRLKDWQTSTPTIEN